MMCDAFVVQSNGPVALVAQELISTVVLKSLLGSAAAESELGESEMGSGTIRYVNLAELFLGRGNIFRLSQKDLCFWVQT